MNPTMNSNLEKLVSDLMAIKLNSDALSIESTVNIVKKLSEIFNYFEPADEIKFAEELAQKAADTIRKNEDGTYDTKGIRVLFNTVFAIRCPLQREDYPHGLRGKSRKSSIEKALSTPVDEFTDYALTHFMKAVALRKDLDIVENNGQRRLPPALTAAIVANVSYANEEITNEYNSLRKGISKEIEEVLSQRGEFNGYWMGLDGEERKARSIEYEMPIFVGEVRGKTLHNERVLKAQFEQAMEPLIALDANPENVFSTIKEAKLIGEQNYKADMVEEHKIRMRRRDEKTNERLRASREAEQKRQQAVFNNMLAKVNHLATHSLHADSEALSHAREKARMIEGRMAEVAETGELKHGNKAKIYYELAEVLLLESNKNAKLILTEIAQNSAALIKLNTDGTYDTKGSAPVFRMQAIMEKMGQGNLSEYVLAAFSAALLKRDELTIKHGEEKRFPIELTKSFIYQSTYNRIEFDLNIADEAGIFATSRRFDRLLPILAVDEHQGKGIKWSKLKEKAEVDQKNDAVAKAEAQRVAREEARKAKEKHIAEVEANSFQERLARIKAQVDGVIVEPPPSGIRPIAN